MSEEDSFLKMGGGGTYLRSNSGSMQRAVLSSFDYTQTVAFFVAFLVSFPVEPVMERQA